MAAPTILGAKAYFSASFQSSVTSTGDPIDFGTNTGRWCHVVAMTNNTGINVTGVTLGGNAMTAETNVATPMGSPGNGKAFTMIGDGGANIPTGVATVTVTADASTILSMVVTWGHGASVLGTSTYITQAATGGSASWSVSGPTANDLCVVNGYETAQTASGGNAYTAPYVTIAASSGSTLALHQVPPSSGHHHAVVVSEVGAADPTVLGTTTTSYQYTPAVVGWAFKVTGAAPTGPTIDTQPAAQTANEPGTATFTVAATTSGGSLTYQWQRANPGSGSFADVGSATSASYTTGATTAAGDHGAQYRCVVDDDNGPTISSAAVLTVRSVTTTSRPASDVTTTDWTTSSGADFFALIDESVASDADYITSPALSSSTPPGTFGLSYPLNTGTWTTNFRAKTSTGTATMRVYLLNDAGTVVGTSADQTITDAWTSYSLSIVISGPATRGRVEIVV